MQPTHDTQGLVCVSACASAREIAAATVLPQRSKQARAGRAMWWYHTDVTKRTQPQVSLRVLDRFLLRRHALDPGADAVVVGDTLFHHTVWSILEGRVDGDPLVGRILSLLTTAKPVRPHHSAQVKLVVLDALAQAAPVLNDDALPDQPQHTTVRSLPKEERKQKNKEIKASERKTSHTALPTPPAVDAPHPQGCHDQAWPNALPW